MKKVISRLQWALFLTAGFVLVEFLGGIFSNSLALLTDAAHNLTDAIALGLSWYAVRLALRPSTADKTYGYHRAGILAALVNSTTLVGISLGVLYEAYRRLLSPPVVSAGIMVGVGVVAVAINLLTALLVRRGSAEDLNLHSAFLHLMGDVASAAGAVLAGIAIYFTHANWLDPLVGLLIGLLIMYNAWGIVRETVEILLESTPRDVDMQQMVSEILKIRGVAGVHDLHVWSLTRNLRTMSAHILTSDIPISVGSQIQSEVAILMRQRYHISHATLQLECQDCDADDLYCDITDVLQAEGPASEETRAH